MRLKRFIKWTFLGLVTLVVLVGILLFTMDLGFLRPMVEKRVGLATGRDFSIDGDLSIRLGSELVIRAEGVRMGNPSWAGPGDFALVRQLDAVVDARSLWRGPLILRDAEINGLTVGLVRNDKGQGNWQLQAGTQQESVGEPGILLVQSLSLSGAEISLESARLDRPVSARIERLEHNLGPDGQVRGSLDGVLSGRPVHFEVAGGPYVNLLTGDDIRVEATGAMGSIGFQGRADFDNLWTPRRPEIDLQISGPDFEEFTDMLGIEGLGAGNLVLQATTGSAAGQFGLTIAGSVGEFDIDLTSEMPSLQEFDKATLEASLNGRNLGRVARLAGIEDWPEDPFSFAATVLRPEEALQVERFELVLGENRIAFTGNLPAYPEFTDGRLSLEASGQDFGLVAGLAGLDGAPEQPFELRSSMSVPGGVLVVEQFDMQLAGADITLDGRVPGFPELAGAELSLAVNGPELAPFQGFFGLRSPLTGPFGITGTLAAKDNRTILDLQYETTLGGGNVAGTIGSGEGLVGTELTASAAGPDAAELGEIIGMPGLSKAPWTCHWDFSITNPAYFNVSRMAFASAGLSLEFSGRIGAETIYQDTDLRFSVRGDRLADFQELAGDGYALPEQAFEIGGRATVQGEAWSLEDVSGNVGGTAFSLSGRLGNGPGLAGTELTLMAEGDDFSRILELPGHARLPDGPFSGSLSLALDGERLRLAQLTVSAGPFRLMLDADLPWPFELAGAQLNVDVSGVDITRILPELAGFELDAEDYEAHFSGEWRKDRIDIEQGHLRIGENSMIARGSLDLPPNLSATDLVFEVDSPDLSRLGTIDGERWGSVPFRLQSSFSGTQTRFRMEQFRANLGDTDFKGAFAIDFAPQVPAFELQLDTPMLDLRPFLAEPGDDPAAETKSDQGARLIPDTAFPMELLATVNGRFAITAGEVRLRKSTLLNSVLLGTVQDGALSISEAGIDSYGGRLAGTLSLDPRPGGGTDARLTIRSKGLVLDFTGVEETEREKLPAFDIDLDLSGSGHTVREAAATLNGKIIANSPGGQISNTGAYGLEGLFLAKVVSTVSPSASRQKEINITCFATAADVIDGVIQLDPGMALQSDRLNLFAGGRINLASEKLEINFRAQTRKAVDISAGELFSPYVKLSGTLADPSVAVDPKGTLLSGGAAYLSGGLSILARKALDQLGGTKDPCADYLREVASEQP